MTQLKKEYKKFIDDIEKNIKNKEDLNYIKERFAKFLDVVLDQMDDILNYKEEKMAELEETQKQLDEKLQKMQEIVNNIEKDIYSEEGFDFEIVCPYCNNEFVIDVDDEKTEVECPECKNIIELDWSGNLDDEETECNGSCSHCSGCDDIDFNDDDEDDDM